MTKYVIISGYWDPIHSGHINYMKSAKKLGDKLIVIINNDYQANLKKGFSFMDLDERNQILNEFEIIDYIYTDDYKGSDVSPALNTIVKSKLIINNQSDDEYIFANGGDKNNIDDIPETKTCKELGIEMIFNVGGNKTNSSSWIIEKAYKNYQKNK